ncbi:DNA repair protein RecO [Thermoanaerobacterium thermosaccharolyticum]|uniref:DNA repair protein RecO n=1 Tax=Thermoanaerobacterium thermosaccharolyticum TaxID=1517 RepID=UPI0012394F73|nr:DNA repair protein RecO [Thermoanaerobacterium thermosaccharolyticum]KAA5806688.1 DNA repair protein RecO [Thermoanaerobacterium thermosaccharolyticum]
MKFIKTESIVLKSRLIGESDKVITLFTKTNGKIQAIAKGARNSKSRFLGSSHTFSIGYYVLFQGQNYYYVDQWELIHSFLKIDDDILKLSYASYFADVVYKLLQDDDRNINIYNLLKYSLLLLEKGSINNDLLAVLFNLKFVTFMGYMPEVDCCVSCGKKDKLMYFSPAKGGVLCNNCKSAVDDILYLKRDTLNILRFLLNYGFNNIGKIVVQKATVDELDRLMTEYMNVHFDKIFQSKNFLDKIKNM